MDNPDYQFAYFRICFFVNSTTGYAVGGAILKTTNGGATWSTLLTAGNWLSSTYFINADTGYVSGDFGTVIKTVDGGVNWDTLSTPPEAFYLNSLYFTDANTGFAGSVLKTTDGGTTWNLQECSVGYLTYSAAFPDENTGYAVGQYGTIIATKNGGGPVGVNEKKMVTNSLKLYPNPASGNITLETPETGTLSVYNLNGILVLEQKIIKQTTTIDVSKLPEGLYLLKVVGEKQVFVGKFVKQ